MKKVIMDKDGVREVEMTAEEVSRKQADDAKAQEEATANENAKSEKDALKSSATI